MEIQKIPKEMLEKLSHESLVNQFIKLQDLFFEMRLLLKGVTDLADKEV